MTTLYGWGPMFGNRGPSPFVLKCDMQLQMLGLSFERAIADLQATPKGKAPYVAHEGELLQDTTFIRLFFEERLGQDLDAGLSDAQRGTAWAVERLLEDRLSPIMLHERWVEDDNFARGPVQFFAGIPEPMRQQIIDGARADVRSTLIGQGLGRHSRDERMILADLDIRAVSRLLGDQTYLFGHQPTAADAVAFGVLVSCATRFFDSPLPDLIERYDNLPPYLARIDQQFFAQASWPQMAV